MCIRDSNNGNDNSTADRNKVTVDDITVTLKQDDTDMSGYTKTHELGETDGTYTVILTSNKDMKNVTVFAGVEGVLHMTDRSDEATLISKDDAVVLHLAEGENITVSVEIDGAAKGYTISVDNNGQLDVRLSLIHI